MDHATGAIELSVLFPAFIAGLIVLSTHVPMGQQVLGRGIVFIDLSIAQVAGLGVTIAGAAGSDPKGWTVQVAATLAPSSARCCSPGPTRSGPRCRRR